MDHDGDNQLSYNQGEMMVDGSLLPNAQVT